MRYLANMSQQHQQAQKILLVFRFRTHHARNGETQNNTNESDETDEILIFLTKTNKKEAQLATLKVKGVEVYNCWVSVIGK